MQLGSCLCWRTHTTHASQAAGSPWLTAFIMQTAAPGFPAEQGSDSSWRDTHFLFFPIAASPFLNRRVTLEKIPITTLPSSLLLSCPEEPFPCQPVPWPWMSLQHPPWTSQLQGEAYTWPSPQWSLCGHLSEVYMLLSPQWGLHAPISSVRSICGLLRSEAHSRPSSQQGQDAPAASCAMQGAARHCV